MFSFDHICFYNTHLALQKNIWYIQEFSIQIIPEEYIFSHLFQNHSIPDFIQAQYSTNRAAFSLFQTF